MSARMSVSCGLYRSTELGHRSSKCFERRYDRNVDKKMQSEGTGDWGALARIEAKCMAPIKLAEKLPCNALMHAFSQ